MRILHKPIYVIVQPKGLQQHGITQGKQSTHSMDKKQELDVSVTVSAPQAIPPRRTFPSWRRSGMDPTDSPT